MLKRAVNACALTLLVALQSGTAHAQAQVNCALFANAYDQARCIEANEAAARAYWNERAATYSYYGAYGANQLGPYVADRYVPYVGSYTYEGGNWLGTQLYNNYEPTPRMQDLPDWRNCRWEAATYVCY
jgi:hypothetical protein